MRDSAQAGVGSLQECAALDWDPDPSAESVHAHANELALTAWGENALAQLWLKDRVLQAPSVLEMFDEYLTSVNEKCLKSILDCIRNKCVINGT